MKELEDVIKHICYGKACGLDEIPNEMCKTGLFNHDLRKLIMLYNCFQKKVIQYTK
jgi:hypothetical protein